jgi:hypothetical protein
VTDDTGRWKTPTGTLAHRGDCPVVLRRHDVRPAAAEDELQGCAICIEDSETEGQNL